ncbi:MAG TPA: membrane protein insertase YidC [Rhodoglobus sp.]|nr:membrane protein insertase YidC [Rhodoglobus sp.]
MDPYSIPFVATALDAVHWLVTSLATLLTPFAGTGAAALAVVALTVAVRALLIPVGISAVRAELTRRRLAPDLKRLQQRWARNPQRLQAETLALYRREGTSPFAGMLPLLAQAPVLSVVYGLFLARTVNGHANELLPQPFLGVPLGDTLFSAGIEGALAFAPVLLVLLAVGTVQRALTLRQAEAPRWTGWLPYLAVPFAAIAPLAAGLYLAVSSAWTLGERALLRRVLSARPAASPGTP